MKQFIELKKSELIEMFQTIESLKEKYNKNFTYAISFAKRAVKNEAESLIEAIAPSDSYREYEDKRTDLIKKFGAKDEDGKLITNNGAIKIDPSLIDECKIAIKNLEDEYSSVLDEREKDFQNFEKVLEETTTIQFEMIDWDIIPDTIEQSLMDALLPIINKED